MDLTTDEASLEYFDYLLEFLAAWEKRPTWLTRIAYQWSSAVSEAAAGAEPAGWRQLITSPLPRPLPDLGEVFEVGPVSGPVHSGGTPHTFGHPGGLTRQEYEILLSKTLKIGFRLVDCDRQDRPALQLDHASHHEIIEMAFSSGDDETIADAVCIWLADSAGMPLGSFAQYFTERVERAEPFSPRLREASLRAIERIWGNEQRDPAPEIIRLLDRLNVNAGDIIYTGVWVALLVSAIRSAAGHESLSSHYWRLLGKLVLDVGNLASLDPSPCDIGVMRSLEQAEDWGKLENWMVIMWWLPRGQDVSVGDVEQVTLLLLLERPSSLPRFEDLCKGDRIWERQALQRTCDRAREKKSLPGSPYAL